MEELLASARRAKKPGQQSGAEREEQDRLDFGAALIRALEDAERAVQEPKSPCTLAGAAYKKLHYDFPVRGRGPGGGESLALLLDADPAHRPRCCSCCRRRSWRRWWAGLRRGPTPRTR